LGIVPLESITKQRNEFLQRYVMERYKNVRKKAQGNVSKKKMPRNEAKFQLQPTVRFGM